MSESLKSLWGLRWSGGDGDDWNETGRLAEMLPIFGKVKGEGSSLILEC